MKKVYDEIKKELFKNEIVQYCLDLLEKNSEIFDLKWCSSDIEYDETLDTFYFKNTPLKIDDLSLSIEKEKNITQYCFKMSEVNNYDIYSLTFQKSENKAQYKLKEVLFYNSQNINDESVEHYMVVQFLPQNKLLSHIYSYTGNFVCKTMFNNDHNFHIMDLKEPGNKDSIFSELYTLTNIIKQLNNPTANISFLESLVFNKPIDKEIKELITLNTDIDIDEFKYYNYPFNKILNQNNAKDKKIKNNLV